ncbi:hypothetical protein [Marixanthomonas ophiurae]|uniref:DUF4465 domain-containing protein n=1 Tax=Marixanthomonas ophiurae TaxID=387659 RepID=A0A3E1Q930_9FLAO|nr:hypothetical protein [Marixanthomonas ophiurae]RFN58624.1 hypothetical protein DZ858_00660 [Marixanthomonas ophiurae]
MKNVTKKIVLMTFLAFAFVVSSCSEDDTAPSDPTNSEAIEQGSELASLIQRTSDDSDNESIDCIDFVYPLNFFIYNSNNEQIGTQTVTSDSELLSFLLSLESGTYIAMDYPISVVLKDGTVVDVANNAELLALITDCSSSGGDEVPSDFETILTSDSWFVTYFFDDEDETSDFAGYEFTFATDNTAQATNGSNTVEGTWNLTSSSTQDLELFFGNNDPFDELDEDWDIIEATSEIIKLKHISGGDGSVDFLTFERNPSGGGGGGNGDTGTFVDSLTTDNWYVNLLDDDGNDETCDYVAYQFTFNSDETVVAVSDNNTVNGTWAVTNSSSGLDLVLNFEITGEDDPFDDLNDDWDVQEFDANIIKLIDISGGNGGTDYLNFGRNPYEDCNGGGNTDNLETILQDGQWSVGSYIDDGDDETNDYNGYAFTFNADGTAIAESNSDTVNGTWAVTTSSSGLDLVLNFEIDNEDDPFDDLNDDWDVEQFTTVQVDLKDISGGDGSTDLLTFVKL